MDYKIRTNRSGGLPFISVFFFKWKDVLLWPILTLLLFQCMIPAVHQQIFELVTFMFCFFFLIFQKQAVGLICSFIWGFLLYRLHHIFSFFLPKEIKWTFKIISVPVIHFKNCAQCKINKFVEVLFGDFNVKRRTLQIRWFCSKILLRAHISQQYVCGSHV